ncbi:MAG: NUDIX hydrolase [Desulfurococcaceae archaeon]
MGSNREYPRHAIAAVGAVLIRDGKILLVKRRYPPGKGKWSVPGGVLEPGEKLVEAARRELLEETGLEAEPRGVLWILNNVVYDENRRVLYHYLIVDVLFDPDTVRGEPKPGSDAEEVAWIDLAEAKSRTDVSRTVKRLIERIEKYGLTTLPLEGVDFETTTKA